LAGLGYDFRADDLPFSVPPTALDRLAGAIFVNRQNPKGAMMAMFTAYFDASGEERQPFIVVSGFVANFSQWSMLGRVWKEVHEEAEADLPFHMSEFMSACQNPDRYAAQSKARADYVRLSRDPEKAQKFLHQLAMTEVSTMHCGISCMVPMDLYNDISSLLNLREVIPPYALGARMCIERLRQWQDMFAIGEPVEYVFEAGDFGQAKFTDLMVDEGQPIPIYKNKADFAGLQAADHYAWEQFNVRKRHQQDANYVPNETAYWLIWGIPKLHVEPTRETLIRLCEAKGIDPRTGVRK